jgi:hypothetical protein
MLKIVISNLPAKQAITFTYSLPTAKNVLLIKLELHNQYDKYR